ncbi:MAG: helix-turn-helix domain-containing protein [Spirochaetaceae bacterium]
MREEHHLLGENFFTSGEIPLKILHRDPQPEYPIHTHDFSELVIVLKGQGTHFTHKNDFKVQAGDLFVINGDLAHGYKDLDNLVLINILFDMQALKLPNFDIGRSPGFHTLFTIEPLLREDSKFSSRLKLDYKEIDFVINLVKKMEDELKNRQDGYHYLTVSLFMQLIAYLSRCYSDKSRNDSSSLYQLGETISFIEHNLDRNITVNELLNISHMSESSLLRAFKKITGSSPLNFHLKKRIDKSCKKLIESNDSITMIAYDIGFSDSNYFSRQFKKIKGETPGTYRKRSR